MWRRSEGVSETYLFKLSAAASDDLYRWSAAQWTLQSEKLWRGVVVEVKWRLTSERKLRPVCTSGVHAASLEPQFNQVGPKYIVLYRRPNQNQGDTSGGGMWGAIVGAFSREMWRTPDNRKHSYFLGLVPDLGKMHPVDLANVPSCMLRYTPVQVLLNKVLTHSYKIGCVPISSFWAFKCPVMSIVWRTDWKDHGNGHPSALKTSLRMHFVLQTKASARASSLWGREKSVSVSYYRPNRMKKPFWKPW